MCVVMLALIFTRGAAQMIEFDRESRMAGNDPFFDQEKPEALASNVPERVSKEIKYTAGADGAWFTKDDDVHEYYLLHYDNKGRFARRSGYLEGVDGLLMTDDDILDDYMTYEFRPDGQISRESLYTGKGILQYIGVYAYDDAGQKMKVTRYGPQNNEIGSINYFHGHAGLIVKDVEYKGDEIVKYHLFAYDNKHKMGKVREFHGSEGGRGKDGVWFTADDAVTSTKECFYGADSRKTKEKKYIGPGADKKWFTKDDTMQYYTVFHY